MKRIIISCLLLLCASGTAVAEDTAGALTRVLANVITYGTNTASCGVKAALNEGVRKSGKGKNAGDYRNYRHDADYDRCAYELEAEQRTLMYRQMAKADQRERELERNAPRTYRRVTYTNGKMDDNRVYTETEVGDTPPWVPAE